MRFIGVIDIAAGRTGTMEEMTILMMLKKINDLMCRRASTDLEQVNLTLMRLHENDKEEVSLRQLEHQFEAAQAAMAGILT